MTKEEAIEHIKLIRFNAALINANAFREALDMAIEALSHPSLPSNLDDAAEKYSENILANNEDLQDAIEDAFKAGAEWMAGQDRKIWNSSIRSVPEGNKSQILSFDAEGYFYLDRKPHPDSVEWCFAKELLPIRKKQ